MKNKWFADEMGWDLVFHVEFWSIKSKNKPADAVSWRRKGEKVVIG